MMVCNPFKTRKPHKGRSLHVIDRKFEVSFLTDRGAREALAAVLEAEDLTLASTTKALRRVEGFSHPPHPGRGRWGASGNTSRGNSAARENPHAAAAAKSASKKPQRKPK